MLRIDASRASFERQSSSAGRFPQSVQFRFRDFVEGKIIRNLHHANVRFNSLFEQVYCTQRPRWLRVSPYADRPRNTPGSDSEFHAVQPPAYSEAE
jgi:hypothetical protein